MFTCLSVQHLKMLTTLPLNVGKGSSRQIYKPGYKLYGHYLQICKRQKTRELLKLVNIQTF